MKFALRKKEPMTRVQLIAYLVVWMIVVVCIGILIFSAQLYYRNKSAAVVGAVCHEYYDRNTTLPFTVEPSYDSDGDGYGSCTVFSSGAIVAALECTGDLWFNPRKCRKAKKVME